MGRRKVSENPRKERVLKRKVWSKLSNVAEKFMSCNFLKMTTDYSWSVLARRPLKLK